FFAVFFAPLRVDFFAVLRVAFFAAFLAVFLAAFFAVLRAPGPPVAASLARRSDSSSLARASVSVSGLSPLRSDALVVPSVTYGPKRPSFTVIGLPETSLSPSSFSGGFAAARPRRLGSA